jgi:hypothetical protein
MMRKKCIRTNQITTPEVMSTNESTSEDMIDKEPDKYDATAFEIVSVILTSNVTNASFRAAAP